MIPQFLCTLALSSLVSGCMYLNVYETSHHTYTNESLVSTVVTHKTTPSAPINIHVPVQKPTPAAASGCPPFKLPPNLRLPEIPDFDLSDKPLEEQIAVYIKALRKTIKLERTSVDDAVKEHHRVCGV